MFTIIRNIVIVIIIVIIVILVIIAFNEPTVMVVGVTAIAPYRRTFFGTAIRAVV